MSGYLLSTKVRWVRMLACFVDFSVALLVAAYSAQLPTPFNMLGMILIPVHMLLELFSCTSLGKLMFGLKIETHGSFFRGLVRWTIKYGVPIFSAVVAGVDATGMLNNNLFHAIHLKPGDQAVVGIVTFSAICVWVLGWFVAAVSWIIKPIALWDLVSGTTVVSRRDAARKFAGFEPIMLTSPKSITEEVES